MPGTISVMAKDVMIVDLSGEAVILNTDNWIYYGLNGMGYRVWNLIQEPKRIDEIRSLIQAMHGWMACRALDRLSESVQRRGVWRTCRARF